MNTVRWNIAVSADTDRSLRMYLAGQDGGCKGDLSRFIEDAVRVHILELTADGAKAANASVNEAALTEKNLLLFFEHYDAVQDGVAPEVLYDIRNRLQEALRTAISGVTLMLGDWFRDGEDEPMLCFEVRLRQAPDIPLQLLCKAPRRRI